MNYISIAGSLGLRSGRTKKPQPPSVRNERLVGAARCPAARNWGAEGSGEAARKASTSNRRRCDLSQITQTLSKLGHQHRSGRLTRSHVPSTTAELATALSISPLFSPSTREPRNKRGEQPGSKPRTGSCLAPAAIVSNPSSGTIQVKSIGKSTDR